MPACSSVVTTAMQVMANAKMCKQPPACYVFCHQRLPSNTLLLLPLLDHVRVCCCPAGCGHVEHHYGYWHMMDQYHCMVTSTGEWAVDFLGRVEHGDEDWKVVVNEMNARRLPGVPEVQYSSYGHVHKVEPGQKPPEPKKKQHTRPPPSLRMSARRSLRYVPFGQAAGGACEDPDGPYCGANEHCIDAVSQWYACDAEKFGYLPKLNATRRQQQRLR